MLPYFNAKIETKTNSQQMTRIVNSWTVHTYTERCPHVCSDSTFMNILQQERIKI